VSSSRMNENKNKPSPFISSERKSKYEKNIPQHSVDLKMINDECTNLVRIVRIFMDEEKPNLEVSALDWRSLKKNFVSFHQMLDGSKIS